MSKTPAIEYKTFPFTIKSVKEMGEVSQSTGVLEGFASTFNNIDRSNDIIERNAFDDTVQEFRSSGRKLRVLFQHQTLDVIGTVDPMALEVTDKGLHIKADLVLGVQRANEVFLLAKAGAISDFSIGFSIEDSRMENRDGEQFRILTKLTLWEVSAVVEPANPEATIDVVKTALPDMSQEDGKDRKVNCFKELSGITNVREFEKCLQSTKLFSRSQATALASAFFKESKPRDAVFSFFTDEEPQSEPGEQKQYTEMREIVKTLGEYQSDSGVSRKDSALRDIINTLGETHVNTVEGTN